MKSKNFRDMKSKKSRRKMKSKKSRRKMKSKKSRRKMKSKKSRDGVIRDVNNDLNLLIKNYLKKQVKQDSTEAELDVILDKIINMLQTKEGDFNLDITSALNDKQMNRIKKYFYNENFMKKLLDKKYIDKNPKAFQKLLDRKISGRNIIDLSEIIE
jgi:hypothetical protein